MGGNTTGQDRNMDIQAVPLGLLVPLRWRCSVSQAGQPPHSPSYTNKTGRVSRAGPSKRRQEGRQGAHPHQWSCTRAGRVLRVLAAALGAWEIRTTRSEGNPSHRFILLPATGDKTHQKALRLFLGLGKMVFNCMW